MHTHIHSMMVLLTVFPRHTTPPTATPVPTTTPPNPPSNQPIVISHWGAIQEERTRGLFAKYGLPLSQCDLRPVDASVQRVVKPIRMRVRRSCHRCQTVFGVARVCVNCQHTRCKSCPRHPAPKPKEDSEAVLRNLLAQKGKMPLYRQQGQGQTQTHRETQGQGQKQPRPGHYVLKLPSRTGGQDLVRKPIRQRVRRTCHRCQTTFASGSKQCSECQHVRCKKCPRDPYVHHLSNPKPINTVAKLTNAHSPKLDKYPDGYPGDVDPPPEPPARTWKKPRLRVRYTCHQCATLYRSGQKSCAGCGQERCAETLREPCVPLFFCV